MRININVNNLRANFTIANIAFAEQELHPELVQCSTNEVCPDCALLKSSLRFLVISAMKRLGNVQCFKTYMFRF